MEGLESGGGSMNVVGIIRRRIIILLDMLGENGDGTIVQALEKAGSFRG